MSDPQRISRRSFGLAAELLRAGAAEQPPRAAMERTLAALGVSAAVLTSATGASGMGVLAGAGAASAATSVKAVKAVSTLLLVKWIGVGMVGGVGLAGAAAVASRPFEKTSPTPQADVVAELPPALARAAAVPPAPARVNAEAPAVATAEPAPSVPEPVIGSNPRDLAATRYGDADVGTPLAAEVTFVDRARSLLASGRAEQAFALLQDYEREFPEARLLPEVLFLRIETGTALRRDAEARAAAQRLVDGFPRSPHVSRARKLLNAMPGHRQ